MNGNSILTSFRKRQRVFDRSSTCLAGSGRARQLVMLAGCGTLLPAGLLAQTAATIRTEADGRAAQTVRAADAPPVATPAASSLEPLPRAASTRDVRSARDEYLAGARLLAHDELPAAQVHFEHAAKLDPSVPAYQIGARLAVEHRVTALVQQAGRATMLGQAAAASTLLAEARTLDPENDLVQQHAPAAPEESHFEPVGAGVVPPHQTDNEEPWQRQEPALAGPIVLKPNDSRQNFHIRADLQSTARQVFSSFGIRPVFDDSVTSAETAQALRFDLDNTNFAQGVPILLSMGRLFMTPLDAHSVLLAKDTPANRTRFEHLYQETIYTPGLTPQQLGEVANVIRQIFDVRQLSMQNTADNITLRAPAGTLDALNRTLTDLLAGSAEVTLDLRLFSVDTSRVRNIGPNLPQQFGVYNVASAAQSLVTANQTAVDAAISQGLITLGTNQVTNLLLEAGFLIQSGLATSSLLSDTIGFFGKGLSLTGATVAGSTGLTLALNSSDTRALEAVQLRATDHQTAVFKAGTRYPIVTAVYSSGITSTNSTATINGVSVASLLNQYLGSVASQMIPQFQYEDLGVTLEATPNVQSSGNISLHLDLKIEALAGSSEDNIPILASRRFASDVTVGDGQTALLLSSLSKTESIAVNGVPGLAELPGFQGITSDRDGERDTSEVVLLITPRLTRHRLNLTVGPRIPVSMAPDATD